MVATLLCLMGVADNTAPLRHKRAVAPRRP
ncbi:hypothetical protein SMD11_6611 [Streptomyces albireticuli]|uniref:Uncharacterized protein n=1 Tax=Streptomyces albireticuli TaxID=1940 RepID=A0A1Z2LD03_9ACTN|nr:hypothetical protein SMD11_6611 [Streptomyces albireticuli]